MKRLNEMISDDTMVVSLTLGDLKRELGISSTPTTEPKKGQKEYLYGLQGIKDFFGCSQATAQRLKDGKLAPAVTQIGRKILVDKEMALALLNK